MKKFHASLAAALIVIAAPVSALAQVQVGTYSFLQVSLLDLVSTSAGAPAPEITFGAFDTYGGASLNGGRVEGVFDFTNSVVSSFRDGTTGASAVFQPGALVDFTASGGAKSTGNYSLNEYGSMPFTLSAFSKATFEVRYTAIASVAGADGCASNCPFSAILMTASVDAEAASATPGLYLELAAGPGEGEKQNAGSILITVTTNANMLPAALTFAVEHEGSTALPFVPAPVPEPSTWALMFFGLGAVGLRAARQRQK